LERDAVNGTQGFERSGSTNYQRVRT